MNELRKVLREDVTDRLEKLDELVHLAKAKVDESEWGTVRTIVNDLTKLVRKHE